MTVTRTPRPARRAVRTLWRTGRRTGGVRSARRARSAVRVLSLPVLAAGVLLLCVLTGVLPGGTAPQNSAPDATDRSTVRDLLETVVTVPRRVHVLGYDRDQFGGWATRVTAQGQLCTTRDLVLFRQFGTPGTADIAGTTDTSETAHAADSGETGEAGDTGDSGAGGVTASGRECPTAVGETVDPYSGDRLPVGDVEVDHVVPLSAAWDHGAWAWPRTTRVAFANDVERNLLAVSTDRNQAKSDGTPAEWLPHRDPRPRCAYAARYLTVTAVYGLTLSEADADAARGACGL